MATVVGKRIGGHNNSGADPDDTITFPYGQQGKVVDFFVRCAADGVYVEFDGNAVANPVVIAPGVEYRFKAKVYSQVRVYQKEVSPSTPNFFINWVEQ